MTARVSSASVREQDSNRMTISTLKTLALTALLSLTGWASAHGQVLVMNEDRILTESAVGQHIANEIVRIRDQGTASLTAESERLNAEGEALSAETSALSEAALAQRQDLRDRFEALTTAGVELEVDRAVLQQELIGTQQQAMVPVLEALQEVLQQIVDERGAGVLLDRSQVVYVSEAASITDLAIERMNARIPTTPVNRVRLNDEQRNIIRQQVVGQIMQQQRMLAQAQAQNRAAQQQ